MLQEQPASRPNLVKLVNTWVLCGILLVLGSMYGFSFEHSAGNTMAGSKTQGLTAGSSEESDVIRIQNAGMYLVCAVLMFPLIKHIGVEFRRDILISSLLLWMLCSCIWSNDASASITNGVRMVADVALAVYLLKRYAVNDLLKILILLGSVAAASSLVLVLAFPQYGLQSRDLLYAFGAWQGIFGQKNLCGSVMTLLLLPAFFVQLDGRRARAFRISYIAVLLVIIAMTQSAGSWVLCSCCLVFIGTLRLLLRLNRKDAWTAGMVLLGMIAAAMLAIASDPDAFLRIIGKDPGMDGRSVIWSSLLLSAEKHPFVGYGFRAFWQGLRGESANAILRLGWTGMGYAENGVLELWLELGAVGVLLYALVFIRAAKDAVYCLRRNPPPSTMWYSSILFYLVISNIWAGNLLLPSFLQCILPFVAYAGLRRDVARLREFQS
jgi:exopolysaccharide production protein ExoQ